MAATSECGALLIATYHYETRRTFLSLLDSTTSPPSSGGVKSYRARDATFRATSPPFASKKSSRREGIRFATSRLQRRCIEAHRLGAVWIEAEEITGFAPEEVSRSAKAIETEHAVRDTRDRDRRQDLRHPVCVRIAARRSKGENASLDPCYSSTSLTVWRRFLPCRWANAGSPSTTQTGSSS